jgi:hypothetical protein
MVTTVDGRVPDPDKERDPVKRDAMEKALVYMGLTPNTPIENIRIDKVFIGSCTNSRIEDLRAAAAVVRGRQRASNVKLAMVVPGSGLVKEQAEREGLDRIFKAGRALRLDLEPQLRRPPGAGRTHPPGVAGDGRRGRDRGPLRRRFSVGVRAGVRVRCWF